MLVVVARNVSNLRVVLEPSQINRRPRKAKKKTILFRFSGEKVVDLPEVLDFSHVGVIGKFFFAQKHRTTRKSSAIVKPPVYGVIKFAFFSYLKAILWSSHTRRSPPETRLRLFVSVYTPYNCLNKRS